MTFLSKVDDVFQITGRGCVVVPGVPDPLFYEIDVHRSDPIQLRKPDGSVIQTHIRGWDMVSGSPKRSCVPLYLGPELTKSDIPTGTEVWLDVDQETLDQRREAARSARRSRPPQ